MKAKEVGKKYYTWELSDGTELYRQQSDCQMTIYYADRYEVFTKEFDSKWWYCSKIIKT